MPSPDGSSPYVLSSFTNDLAVNSLISGTQWASRSISFSFPPATSYWSTDPTVGYGESTGSGEPWSPYYSPLSSTDINAVRTALKSWANVANITFNETTDNLTVVGDLRFAYTYVDAHSNAQAWAYFPLGTPNSGDVWFNDLGTSASEVWTLGSYEYLTVIHELGHALGLKHSFSQTGYNKQIMPADLDARMYTVMSYNAYPGIDTYFSYEPTTPMVLDIAAIQSLYGANTSYNSGNTNYVFSEQSIYNETIWDAGGIDTFIYNSSSGGKINLTAGVDNGSLMGLPVYIRDSFGNNLYVFYSIMIANGVVIENATGGSGDDLITGNSANNILIGGLGNDTLNGGDGIDTASYDGTVTGVTVNLSLTSAQNTVGAGTDTLLAIENLTGSSFNDTLTGNTGNNVLNGGLGNDTLKGAAGNDTLNGGGGIDTASYDGTATGVTVNLSLTSAQNTVGAGTDILLAIENLIGSGFNDTLTGNTGNNVLNGGLGNDTLTGGTGLDYFLFNTPLSESNNKDLITDFNIVDDVIQLENSIMTSIGSTTGVLASTEFFVGTAAHDADDYIIYNKSTGALYYDKDGTGISAAVQIAIIGTTSHPSLTYADFWVV